MKTIAVMEGANEKEFKSYLKYLLDLLQIEHSFLNIKNLGEKQLDYAVLNSCESQFKEANLRADYCLVNMDNSFEGNINIYGNIITYGLGNKNTVTVSSLEDNNEGFVYCLQRYLTLKFEKLLDPQEIPVGIKFSSHSELYAAIVAVTVALLEGFTNCDIEKKLNKKVMVLT